MDGSGQPTTWLASTPGGPHRACPILTGSGACRCGGLSWWWWWWWWRQSSYQMRFELFWAHEIQIICSKNHVQQNVDVGITAGLFSFVRLWNLEILVSLKMFCVKPGFTSWPLWVQVLFSKDLPDTFLSFVLLGFINSRLTLPSVGLAFRPWSFLKSYSGEFFWCKWLLGVLVEDEGFCQPPFQAGLDLWAMFLPSVV